mmetsp:Transcript_29529/g.59583  ORF Transcript_29529/g.59583 Transcript_29529/m.59583 type:complete len:313 (-) Transcript_29529:51-989(-)
MQGGNAPWVSKASRRRKQDKTREKKAVHQEGMRGNLDPASATFVPTACARKQSTHSAAIQDVSGGTAQTEEGHQAQDRECDDEAQSGEGVELQRQRSLEHNMLWAEWVRGTTGGEAAVEPRAAAMRRHGSFEEREERALERFNTGWVEGLLSESVADYGGSRPAEEALTVSGNNREWSRWVIAPSGGSLDEGDEGERGRLADLLEEKGQHAVGKEWKRGMLAGTIGAGKGCEAHAPVPALAPHPISPPCGPDAMKEQDGAVKTFTPGWVDVEVTEGGERPPALFLGIHPSLLEPSPSSALFVVDSPCFGHSS